MRWAQFFDNFEYSDNLLIINILQINLSFLPSNSLKNPLTFKFLFKHFSKAEFIHFLTFRLKHVAFFCTLQCFFLYSALFFIFQRTAAKIPLRCK